MLVDDSEDIRMLLTSLLTMEGHSVSEFDNGKDALQALTNEPLPDLVLVDWRMPSMTGKEFIAHFRALSFPTKVPPVYLFTAEHDLRQFEGLGFAGMIQKPVDIPQLLSICKKNELPECLEASLQKKLKWCQIRLAFPLLYHGRASTTGGKVPSNERSSMKKVLFTGLLISSLFFNVACDSDEIAAGVIGVGIGIGLGGLDDGGHHDGRHDGRHNGDYNGGYDRGYDRGRDHGGWDRGDRNRNCGPGYRCMNAVETASSTDAVELLAASKTATFAEKHNISSAAAVKVQEAFANVSQSGLSSFQAIGLNENALKAIMNRSLPSDASIRAMSAELNLSEAQSRSLLQNLVAEFSQQASNFNSSYWQSCQAKGQWKTPQNAHCTTGAWNGCSPETGATLCY